MTGVLAQFPTGLSSHAEGLATPVARVLFAWELRKLLPKSLLKLLQSSWFRGLIATASIGRQRRRLGLLLGKILRTQRWPNSQSISPHCATAKALISADARGTCSSKLQYFSWRSLTNLLSQDELPNTF